jgi:hypothetical protein
MEDLYALKVRTGSGEEHTAYFASEEERAAFVDDMVGTMTIIRSAEGKDICAE